MSRLSSIRTATRVTAVVIALSPAAATVSPVAHGAQPAQGSASESGYCSSMLERLKRYHAIQADPAESRAVREFYAGRARALLERARQTGCPWATSMQITSTASPEPGRDHDLRPGSRRAGGLAVRARQRAAFDRLRPPRRTGARRGQRVGPSSGTSVTMSQSSVSAIKATHTGNSTQDRYCTDVAQLIAEADAAGDQAIINGDAAGADAWWDLADYFLDQATQNGCRFTYILGSEAGTYMSGERVTRR